MAFGTEASSKGATVEMLFNKVEKRQEWLDCAIQEFSSLNGTI